MIKLSTGREVEIDLYKVTRRDFRNFVNPRGDFAAEDLFLAKVTGLSVSEIEELPLPDFNALVREVFAERKKAPNSHSVPTSPS